MCPISPHTSACVCRPSPASVCACRSVCFRLSPSSSPPVLTRSPSLCPCECLLSPASQGPCDSSAHCGLMGTESLSHAASAVKACSPPGARHSVLRLIKSSLASPPSPTSAWPENQPPPSSSVNPWVPMGSRSSPCREGTEPAHHEGNSCSGLICPPLPESTPEDCPLPH